jgi:osmotically-inducible protein OsmY
MPKILALFLLPLLALATASLAPAAGAASSTKAPSAQSRPPVGDEQLEAAIKTKLAKSKIGKDGFHFKVQRGVVTWEGTTNIGQHKGAATRMARSSGAVQVINNIKVSNTGKETVLRKASIEP